MYRGWQRLLFIGRGRGLFLPTCPSSSRAPNSISMSRAPLYERRRAADPSFIPSRSPSLLSSSLPDIKRAMSSNGTGRGRGVAAMKRWKRGGFVSHSAGNSEGRPFPAPESSMIMTLFSLFRPRFIKTFVKWEVPQSSPHLACSCSCLAVAMAISDSDSRLKRQIVSVRGYTS